MRKLITVDEPREGIFCLSIFPESVTIAPYDFRPIVITICDFLGDDLVPSDSYRYAVLLYYPPAQRPAGPVRYM